MQKQKMVTLKMITRLAGPEGVRQPGEVVEVPDNVADGLLAGGYAELTDEPAPAVREATIEPPEQAVSRRKRPPTKRRRASSSTKKKSEVSK